MACTHSLFPQLPCLCGAADGVSDHIGVELHAAAVGLFNGECQRVVGRRDTRSAGNRPVPRLVFRGVGNGTPYACLEKDDVDAGSLQAVEVLAEALTLQTGFVLSLGILMPRPVDAAEGAVPYGTDFALVGLELEGLGPHLGWTRQ